MSIYFGCFLLCNIPFYTGVFFLFVTASDKPDLGLEELSSLNVMSRFQVFEKPPVKENDMEKSPVNVKRSQSILNKLARLE